MDIFLPRLEGENINLVRQRIGGEEGMTGQMVLRYAHPTEQHQGQAMRKLEEFNATKQLAEFEATQPRSLQTSLQ